MRVLVKKVKLGYFRKNQSKRQYAYLLIPSGLEEKTRITKPSSSARKPNPKLSGARSNP